ncbi:hypothetical protein AHIS2_p045 [Acaryochloris phage A-HIS2]|nr:hypothetical protein AHIS2_p045 [Acaryochloris phage A-HIS2]
MGITRYNFRKSEENMKIKLQYNHKAPCGVQIWLDGVLHTLADASKELTETDKAEGFGIFTDAYGAVEFTRGDHRVRVNFGSGWNRWWTSETMKNEVIRRVKLVNQKFDDCGSEEFTLGDQGIPDLPSGNPALW